MRVELSGEQCLFAGAPSGYGGLTADSNIGVSSCRTRRASYLLRRATRRGYATERRTQEHSMEKLNRRSGECRKNGGS